ncbi:MAG TPA: helix-turn-helix domain-containing protein [Candidatus Limnocylindrales bacterium]
MDALALGALFRLVRIRRRLRQRDVARRAGLSDVTVSRIEHGQIGSITHATLDRVAAVLEIRLDYRARWHAGDLDRLQSRDHGLLVEAVAERVLAAGWEVRPEVSFSIWGDRGAIDLLAWRPSDRSLLVVEVKTEVADVGETLRALDAKARRAAEVAASIGWPAAAAVSMVLIVLDGRTNHRRVAAHAETFRSALPDTGRQLQALLAGRRSTAVRALAYMPFRPAGSTRPRSSGVLRVRRSGTAGRAAA